jgi:hypothetical protein
LRMRAYVLRSDGSAGICPSEAAISAQLTIRSYCRPGLAGWVGALDRARGRADGGAHGAWVSRPFET